MCIVPSAAGAAGAWHRVVNLRRDVHELDHLRQCHDVAARKSAGSRPPCNMHGLDGARSKRGPGQLWNFVRYVGLPIGILLSSLALDLSQEDDNNWPPRLLGPIDKATPVIALGYT